MVVVLHDLHLAFRYATRLLVMKDGRIVAQGDPGEIVTAELIEDVYACPAGCWPTPKRAARW